MKAVIVGLGYVGLPLAHAASISGIKVTGLDLDANVVSGLNSGTSHIDDLSDNDIAAAIAAGFIATSDASCIQQADVVVICVPTPLDEAHHPDLSSVLAASRSIVQNLKKGTVVILESTTYPGTTEEIVKPILENEGLVCGIDFNLAFSPERIDPGNKNFGITNTPKVVGGVTANCASRAESFYSNFIDEIVCAKGTREAETAKLLENTYRHINIALVNEFAQLAHELRIDIWDVIKCASTKPFGFQTFWPGAGVGGHCIPIDPNYLAFKVRDELGQPFRFIELAEEINRSMPGYVARRLSEMVDLTKSKVLLLGVTYKANIADQRESPAIPLANSLIEIGAEVDYFDPYVAVWNLSSTKNISRRTLAESLADADAVVILQPHFELLQSIEALQKLSIPVLDTTGKFDFPTITKL